MNKTVLIAGGNGFIGSHLAAAAPEDFEIYAPSRRDFAENDFHVAPFIIHAAGYAAPSIFMKDPVGTIEINTALTIQLLKHVAPSGAFLFCSSSEVYKGLSHAASENEIGTTNPYHPRACYIEGKRSGEVIVNAFREKGVRAITARLGLTYGPGTRKDDARVMNQFIQQALTTGKIKLTDDGSGTVTYCYVDDAAKMLWKVLLNGVHGVYNVGGIQSMTIAELAMRIGRLTDAEVMTSNSSIGISQTKINLTRYNEEFGAPEYTSFEDGLKATIQYQKGLYGVL